MPGRLDPPEVPRRDFLGIAGLLASGAAVFGSIAGMLRLARPAVSPEASTRFRAGRPADFPPGAAVVIPEHKLQIVSTTEGLAALSLVCTHLGCIVKREGADYVCPCHGSKFGERGEVLSGPAPAGLKWHEVSQGADGSVLVDTALEVEPGRYVLIV